MIGIFWTCATMYMGYSILQVVTRRQMKVEAILRERMARGEIPPPVISEAELTRMIKPTLEEGKTLFENKELYDKVVKTERIYGGEIPPPVISEAELTRMIKP